MLSLDPPTPQTALLAAAQKPTGADITHALKRGPSEVLPRLYLTDLFTARNPTQLSTLGITHVVSVLEHAPTFPDTHSLRKLHVPLSDSSDEDILTYLPTTTSFIRDALAESPDSRVLVHCLMGISRSATVICAYLIATTKMTPDEAIVAVQAKRRIVCPNLGFRRQLEDYYMTQLPGRQGGIQGGIVTRAMRGRNVAEAIRKLTGKAQAEPNTGSGNSSSTTTSTLTISDVTLAPS